MRIFSLLASIAIATFAVPSIEVLPFARSSAWAANFSSINGSWKGSGRLRLDDGSSEVLRCLAYYNPKDGGQKLGMAVRCASTSYKFEFRSQLSLDGQRVTGSWEERNFNAEGEISGTFKPGVISLTATGGIETAMDVTYSDTMQEVKMTGAFGTFKGMTLSFTK
ncbi:MAG: hypothetical protein AAFW82_02890 [Pseudomonadota bacterium]